MLTCEQAQELIQDFLDNELSGEEAAQVREHLGACGPCDDSFESMQAFIECVKGKLASPGLPDGLVERIGSALDDLSR